MTETLMLKMHVTSWNKSGSGNASEEIENFLN